MVRKDFKPVYPPLARQARIQGTVVLRAVISKDGSIENLQLISGHPMLAPAAIDAVKPVEVQAVSAERRAGRSGYGSSGKLHAVRRLVPGGVTEQLVAQRR